MAQILSIKIKNYRSFYTEQILCFGIESARNVTAIFGPNSGGKSNTAKAIGLIQDIIVKSANADYKLPYDPFRLREGSDSEDCFFEVVFSMGGRLYIYSIAFNIGQITMEKLEEKSEKVNRMRVIFSRDKNGITNKSAEKFGFGRRLLNKTRKETLLITKAREDNNYYANVVFDMVHSIDVIPGEGIMLQGYAIAIMRNNPDIKEKMIDLMLSCDFAIRDILIEEQLFDEDQLANSPIPEGIKPYLSKNGAAFVHTAHAVRNDDRKVTGLHYFHLDTQESMGTRKFFEMAAPAIQALEYGKTLYIDEFGAFFHTELAKYIIDLFNSEKNDKGASLIINTNNIAIMSLNGLKRDDIVLIQKNLSEESIITPLVKKATRDNEAFEKRYSQGFYGSVPILRDRSDNVQDKAR